MEQLAAKSGRPVTVFLGDGTLRGTASSRTPAVELATRGQSLTAAARVAARSSWRAGPSRGHRGDPYLRAGGRSSRGVTRAWLVLAGLGVLLVLVGLVVADRLARTLVRPITALSEVSHRLANAELTARAEPDGPPELREVAGALNQLAGRIQELLRQEREQVADLSHRLRTPLTALRLEAESLRDEQESARLTAAADALERAVSGLIRQARRRTDGEPGRCDAAAVVADRVAFWQVLAEDTGRAVDRLARPGPAAGGAGGRGTGGGGRRGAGQRLRAHARRDTLLGGLAALAGGAVLTVADEGPGFPAGLDERGVSGGDSTGSAWTSPGGRRSPRAAGWRSGRRSRPARSSNCTSAVLNRALSLGQRAAMAVSANLGPVIGPGTGRPARTRRYLMKRTALLAAAIGAAAVLGVSGAALAGAAAAGSGPARVWGGGVWGGGVWGGGVWGGGDWDGRVWGGRPGGRRPRRRRGGHAVGDRRRLRPARRRDGGRRPGPGDRPGRLRVSDVARPGRLAGPPRRPDRRRRQRERRPEQRAGTMTMSGRYHGFRVDRAAGGNSP